MKIFNLRSHHMSGETKMEATVGKHFRNPAEYIGYEKKRKEKSFCIYSSSFDLQFIKNE